MQTLIQHNATLAAELSATRAQVALLKQQLDWFKRHVFGQKSKRVLLDNPDQGRLFTPEPNDFSPALTKQVVRAHTRQVRKKSESDVNDTGRRFSEDVPQQLIDIPSPELSGSHADDYEVLGTKETYRLAQQVGSYAVLVYRRLVVKKKGTDTITTPPAPQNVLDGCYTDVLLLAGLMVDKSVYHLPLNRQHQRVRDAGVTLSRSTLLNYVERGIELLTPIANAMQRNILQGSYIAMDEVPYKVGRTQAGKSSTSRRPLKR